MLLFNFISIFWNKEFDREGNGIISNKINKNFGQLNNIVSLFILIYKMFKNIIKLRQWQKEKKI